MSWLLVSEVVAKRRLTSVGVRLRNTTALYTSAAASNGRREEVTLSAESVVAVVLSSSRTAVQGDAVDN